MTYFHTSQFDLFLGVDFVVLVSLIFLNAFITLTFNFKPCWSTLPFTGNINSYTQIRPDIIFSYILDNKVTRLMDTDTTVWMY